MEEINYYIKKYFFIIIGLWILKVLVNNVLPEFFPGLFFRTIVGEGYTQETPTLFGTYNYYIYSLILSFFVLIDLNRLRLNKIYIPILTLLSMYTGLFFFSLMLLDKLTEESYV
jgi:hypothetical protein